MAITNQHRPIFSKRQATAIAYRKPQASALEGMQPILDPVCGTALAKPTPYSVNYQGKTFYFCCAGCKAQFLDYPERYIPGYEDGDTSELLAGEISSASLRPVYKCPMHPAVSQSHPGRCPNCGMALKFYFPIADDLAAELTDLKRRFIWSLPFSFNLVLVAMFGESLQWFSRNAIGWVELILALPVVFWAGYPVLSRALASLRNLTPNMWTLIGLGVAASFLYSGFAVIVRALLFDNFALSQLSTYFETSVTLISLTLLGQIFENQARFDTAAALKSLVELAPKVAHRENIYGEVEDVPVNQIQVGDILHILPGEKIPTDGQVIRGHSAVNESMLTGEALPVSKFPGDKLIGATLNITSEITMRAERVGKDTLLADIIDMVTKAQLSRVPIQQMADRVAGKLSALVIVIALLTFSMWALYGPSPGWFFGLNCAIATVIIACPCALGLATPMSVMVAMGESANLGILYRDAEAIEKLCNVDTLILDKTGTLTEGKPSVFRVMSCATITESELLGLAASVSQMSQHPFARAILSAAQDKKITLKELTHFEALPGLGVQGTVQSRHVAIGGKLLLASAGLDSARFADEAQQMQQQGTSVIYVLVDHQLAGMFALADPIKKTSIAAIEKLHAQSMHLILASGDSLATVKQVANNLGIVEFYAELNPAEKLALVQRLQAEESIVAMAGDGINDAPALAQADVGIALGTGTDVAMKSGQIVLVKGDLRKISDARTISQLTLRNMKGNLALAFLYNLIAIPIATGALYPLTGWVLSPLIAAAAMTMSSASVVLNAMALGTSIRLTKIDLEKL